MILECGCGKMYKVRDGSANLPTRCPACGGELKAQGPAPAGAGDAARTRQLEARIQELERRLAEPSALQGPLADLRASAERSDQLERELVETRGRLEKALSAKEGELAAAQESLARAEAERRRLESRLGTLEEGQARALEGKDKTIQALDASISSYRGKVDELQKRVDALESQRLSDLSNFDASLRQREQSDRQQLDRATGTHQKALADLRAELEARIREKDKQISESRQLLDREAAERRRVIEAHNRLQESADRAAAEKDAALAALQATLESYQSKLVTVQKRLESLEELRRADQDAGARRMRDTQALRARLEEAEHLAGDLDHGVASLESALASLRDRGRRLKSTLQEASTGASEARSEVPAAALLPEVLEPIGKPEPPKPWTARRLAPPPAELLAPVPEHGRVEEPSGIFQVVAEAVPPPAPDPVPPAPAPEAESADLPLISAPEEEPAKNKEDSATKRRFSWQKK
jgi:chromosome segregation ATPase